MCVKRYHTQTFFAARTLRGGKCLVLLQAEGSVAEMGMEVGVQYVLEYPGESFMLTLSPTFTVLYSYSPSFRIFSRVAKKRYQNRLL